MKPKPTLSDVDVYRLASEGFDSGKYRGEYACDAIGWPLGCITRDGSGSSMLPSRREAGERWRRLKHQFEMFAPQPGDDSPVQEYEYQVVGWFYTRAQRATALAFAAAMAETGDL